MAEELLNEEFKSNTKIDTDRLNKANNINNVLFLVVEHNTDTAFIEEDYYPKAIVVFEDKNKAMQFANALNIENSKVKDFKVCYYVTTIEYIK